MRQRMVHYVVVIFDNWVYYLLNVQLEDSILFRTNGNTGTSENEGGYVDDGEHHFTPIYYILYVVRTRKRKKCERIVIRLNE